MISVFDPWVCFSIFDVRNRLQRRTKCFDESEYAASVLRMMMMMMITVTRRQTVRLWAMNSCRPQNYGSKVQGTPGVRAGRDASCFVDIVTIDRL